jgi:hypothetical protein
MKNYILNAARVFAVAAFAFVASLLPEGALAQTVVAQPTTIVSGGAAADFGNGPIELKFLQGGAQLLTSLGTGVGSTSGSSTTLTLTATPATPPCLGCQISGSGITSGTTVSNFNGTTTITLSAAMTVPASTALSWGAACPTTPNGATVAPIQAGVTGVSDLPLYTQARVCGYSQNGPGAQVLSFPIGAH